MRDFTLESFRMLLERLRNKNYEFVRFDEYLEGQESDSGSESIKAAGGNIRLNSSDYTEACTVILRHDVDKLPYNSLVAAKIEHKLGIKGSYYFRIVPESYEERIMQEIAELGHEVGYHYEDVDLVLRSQKLEIRSQNRKIDEKKLIDLAYESFCNNLETFRKYFDVKTICMHGSPLSRYDNKIIWKKYSYKDLSLIGEPYFDMNWNEFAYLTDTGRRWDGADVAVRDKVESINYKLKSSFRKTRNIIEALERNEFPQKVMITVHPQRWNDKLFPWVTEYISQNAKNVIKKYFYVSRS